MIATATGWRMAVQTRSHRTDVTCSADPSPAPVTHRFAQGRRAAAWTGNVVSIGDAAVVLEPLEGVSLHMAHAQIDRLIATLPDRDFAPVELADYNRQAAEEADRLRDFLILHYHATTRPEPLWRDLAATAPPGNLAHDLALFRERGHLPIHDGESFAPDSWLSVLIGQGACGLAASIRSPPSCRATPRSSRLAAIRGAIAAQVARLPPHRAYLARYLESPR